MVHLSEQIRDFVYYLTDIITMKDPMLEAKIRGNPHDWQDLPPSKCLRYSPAGVGMPIGDLTSQLFSNVFLNRLDWFVTMELGFKHYGRYVDDFYIVDTNVAYLRYARWLLSDCHHTARLCRLYGVNCARRRVSCQRHDIRTPCAMFLYTAAACVVPSLTADAKKIMW